MENDHVFVNNQNLPFSSIQSNALTFNNSLISQIDNIKHYVNIDLSASSQLSNFAPITVPSGHYLVLGDNRRNSADSRIYGFVPHN